MDQSFGMFSGKTSRDVNRGCPLGENLRKIFRNERFMLWHRIHVRKFCPNVKEESFTTARKFQQLSPINPSYNATRADVLHKHRNFWNSVLRIYNLPDTNVLFSISMTSPFPRESVCVWKAIEWWRKARKTIFICRSLPVWPANEASARVFTFENADPLIDCDRHIF